MAIDADSGDGLLTGAVGQILGFIVGRESGGEQRGGEEETEGLSCQIPN